MNKNMAYSAIIVSLIIVSFAFIYGCGANPTGGGSSSGITVVANRVGTFEYSGTQSPGDIWTWTISTETFFGTDETNGFSVSGTWETLSNMFCKAFVNTSSDPSVTGEVAYFLEFPNTMLIIHPVSTVEGQGDNIIICAAHSSASPVNGPYAYITIPWKHWDNSDAAYGTVEVSSGLNFDVTTYLLTDEVDEHFIPAGTYSNSNGVLTSSNPSDPTIFMTPSNVFMSDNGTNGGFAGASVEAAISITDIASHNYRGVRFLYDTVNGTNETRPIAAYPAGTNQMNGAEYPSGVESALDSVNYVSMTFEASTIPGIIPMFITDHGAGPVTLGTSIYKAVAAIVGPDAQSKYHRVLFGFGVEGGQPCNFLVMSVD